MSLLRVLREQSAHFYGELAYYDYDGVSDDVQEKEALAAAIGDKSVLIMRNHGDDNRSAELALSRLL